MSLNIGEIKPEHPGSFALEFGKIAEYDFVYTLASYKYEPFSSKLGVNVHDYKRSDEFDFGSNRTRTVQVVCPRI